MKKIVQYLLAIPQPWVTSYHLAPVYSFIKSDESNKFDKRTFGGEFSLRFFGFAEIGGRIGVYRKHKFHEESNRGIVSEYRNTDHLNKIELFYKQLFFNKKRFNPFIGVERGIEYSLIVQRQSTNGEVVEREFLPYSIQSILTNGLSVGFEYNFYSSGALMIQYSKDWYIRDMKNNVKNTDLISKSSTTFSIGYKHHFRVKKSGR